MLDGVIFHAKIDLHDVEFVTSAPFPCPEGDHLLPLTALTDPSLPDTFHLRPPHKPLGKGDENILEGLRTLSELRDQGIIKRIGIAALALPLLLRIALLAKEAGIAIDIIQTYAQSTILNPLLAPYIPHYREAGVKKVTNAAPLAMGILTSSGGPDWHPARNLASFAATREAVELCKEKGSSIENVALDFGLRKMSDGEGGTVPVVVGCKSIEEVKRTVRLWREINIRGVRAEEEDEKAKEVEEAVVDLFEKRGVRNFTWQSPAPGAI